MQGFKSFPDQTLIEFHPGITAIVGPNGSGKSNITDAIRWVLGEQSVKTLRGARMEDVIFNGTETRRQLGFAEVTITFDNKDHYIPLDYETVEVTRRYYRSGDSEYLINKVQCRLKDIRELFLDTGIGRDGYSIIGQGRIDQILSDNSEERRKVFDEAAGIVKFKIRKRDAERKLERTEQNLVRIEDIVQEIAQRLDPLEKQAEKTKIYQKLSREVRDTDIGLNLYDIKRNQIEYEKSKQVSDDLSEDLETARKLAQTLKNDYQKYEKNLAEIDREIETKRLQQSVQNADLAELGEKRAIGKERKRSLKLQIESNLNQQSELKIEERLLDGDLEQKQIQNKKLTEEIAELTKSFESATKVVTAQKQELNQLNDQIEKIGRELKQKQDQIFNLKNSTTSYSQEIIFVAEQISLLETEIKNLNLKMLDIQTKHHEKTQEYKNEQESFALTNSDLIIARQKTEKVRAELLDLDQTKQQLTNELNNSQYRLKTLQELEASREGFHQAVKAIMQKVESEDEFGAGIHGPLAELINVPQKYEKAIEVTLGAALHNIVTSTKADASRMIEWLKQTRSGRETFLPLDTIRARYVSEHDLKRIEQQSGFLSIASTIVGFSEEYTEIIGQLLGRVIIAENLEQALKISAEIRQKYKVVTLAGDIVQVGGSMTGGQDKKQSPGLLRRNREITEYQQKISELDNKINSNNSAIEKKTSQLIAMGQIQADLEKSYLEKEKYLYQLATLTEQIMHELEQVKQELNNKTDNLDKYRVRTEQVTQKKLETETDLTQAEQIQSELSDKLEALQQSQSAANQKFQELQDQLIALNISLQTKKESQANFAALAEQAKLDFTSQKSRQENLAKQTDDLKHELEKLSEQIVEYENRYQNIEKELSYLSEAINHKQQERSQIEKQQHDLFTKVELQADQVSNLQLQLERSRQRTERLEQSIASAKNHIWENYEITYIEIKQEEYPIENITEARETLKRIRGEIRDLGPINPNAIEEYNEVFERHDFMLTQKADIELSKTKLIDVIRDLEAAMSKQFVENFVQINHNFNEVFSALFTGGEAELDLETADPLTSGIVIKVQPPGKRLQNLNLLSGGEKSLTAIALLLAIFKLRPAPFCILDEVESALDETNIIRFTEYLTKYTDESQFVLVTHRKGTMEAAERLYGITMKERGVSKVLSLELTDADMVNE
ncbi:MAG TPA: chromosome segregation protein SMC [Clostridiaceae bacterium]|nr:chromosome segregation protein SMC [Clostridiaceae bacterium]